MTFTGPLTPRRILLLQDSHPGGQSIHPDGLRENSEHLGQYEASHRVAFLDRFFTH